MQQWVKNQIQKNAEKPAFISPVLLVPKAAISNISRGRSSDLLHFFAAFPSACGRQWQEVAKKLLAELTASGNVQDSHLVPFSPRPKSGTYAWQKYKVKTEKWKNFFEQTPNRFCGYCTDKATPAKD